MSTNMALTSTMVEEFIKRTVKESERNRLVLIDGSPVFDEPLVAFGSGDDPLFVEYKTIIGEFHMTPGEALEKATGKKHAKVSIISWVLPLSEKPKATMRREKHLPTKMWAHALYYGPRFNDFLRAQLIDYLVQAGYDAVAPYTADFFERVATPIGQSSNYSERHVAYACGLGTFSLNDGMITPKGIAMFCGSVVTDLELPPSPRRYTSHIENCAFLVNGSCGRCIQRCPSGAITEKGHDKVKCFNYRFGELAYLREPYGLEKVGCGFCLTGVPCESCIPEGLLKQATQTGGQGV